MFLAANGHQFGSDARAPHRFAGSARAPPAQADSLPRVCKAETKEVGSKELRRVV